MSKYDQRMLKPSSNLIHCQFTPLQLLPRKHNLINNQTSPVQLSPYIKIKLYKGQKICDQNKISTQVTTSIQHENPNNTSTIKINKIFLNFTIPKIPTQQLTQHTKQYSIKLYNCQLHSAIFNLNMNQQQNGIMKQLQISELDNRQKQKQFGSCVLTLQPLLQQFNNKNFRHFRHYFLINEHYCLLADIYMQKSRFMLQKFVRAVKENLTQPKLIFQIKYLVDNYQVDQQPKQKIVTQLYHVENKQQSSKSQTNRYASSTRNIQKNKVLSIKNSKKLEKNIAINPPIQQEDSANCQSINKMTNSPPRHQLYLDVKQVNNQIQYIEQAKSQNGGRNPESDQNKGKKFRKASQFQNDPLQDISYFEGNSLLKSSVQNQQIQDIQIAMTKSQYQNNQVKSKYKNREPQVKQNKNIEVLQRYKNILAQQKQKQKKTNNKNVQEKQQKYMHQQTRHQQKLQVKKYNNNFNPNIRQNIYYLGFILISFILLLNAMSPSRKT